MRTEEIRKPCQAKTCGFLQVRGFESKLFQKLALQEKQSIVFPDKRMATMAKFVKILRI